MNILITGAAGLIGSHLAEYLKKQKIGTILTPNSKEFDITSERSVLEYFSIHKPSIIVHCAAFTDVTGGEQQRGNQNGTAWKINVEGTKNVIDACKKYNSRMIHISTDMVFSGKKDDPGPYIEDHPLETNSYRLSWYGWTKAEAERLIKKNLTDYAIVRVSNPTRAHFEKKLDYLHKITAAYDAGKPVRLFDDQHLTLTYIDEISESVLKIIKKKVSGIFHVSSSNLFTPYAIGVFLLDKTRNAGNIVQRSSLEEFMKQPGNSARYVQFSGLDTNQTQKRLGIRFKSWQEIIEVLIAQKSFLK